jgi:hypothetical protein
MTQDSPMTYYERRRNSNRRKLSRFQKCLEVPCSHHHIINHNITLSSGAVTKDYVAVFLRPVTTQAEPKRLEARTCSRLSLDVSFDIDSC